MRDLKTKILSAVAANQAEILEFAKALVAIPTENPPGAYYKPCVEAIGRELSEIGLDYEVIEVPNPLCCVS
jgi:acetylornithine deacetylase/succinyl-diaminopimelate desuccinylase-like protein